MPCESATVPAAVCLDSQMVGVQALGQIYVTPLMGCTPLGRRSESEVSQKTCHIVNGIAPAANGRFSCRFWRCSKAPNKHNTKAQTTQPLAAKTASGSTCFIV